MAPNKAPDKKVRRVTVSGAVPYDAIEEIEAAARSLGLTLSAFVADVVVDAAQKENRRAAKLAKAS